MSLDVYLTTKTKQAKVASSGIFVRENGETKELTQEEWSRKYPDMDPVKFEPGEWETNVVFSANITHNLGKMAGEAGIYEALWRPHRLKPGYNISDDDHKAELKFEEENPSKAEDLIGMLGLGLDVLKSDPEHFKKLNPENGWGNYDGLVRFVEKYLNACQEYPDSDIEISR